MYIDISREYLCLCFMFYVEGRQANRQSFSIEFLPFVYFLFFAAFVQNRSHFGFFLGIYASIRFEIFSCVAHLHKYLSSAFKDESCE